MVFEPIFIYILKGYNESSTYQLFILKVYEDKGIRTPELQVVHPLHVHTLINELKCSLDLGFTHIKVRTQSEK